MQGFIDNDIQLIWQAGKLYIDEYMEKIRDMDLTNIRIRDFIREMDLAYSVADLVISRAGAISVSELSAAGKAAILVPSPNVAEDHQTKNANSLVSKSAAILVTDRDAPDQLVKKALELINDDRKLGELSENIARLAHRNSAEEIVKTITGLLN